ncbi:DAL5-Allantoate ureidosuccinate permease [Fusarium napiforme]|uniref:DAL5-Allantoate ureidosuccinate permease n=1 Tax=Fusarium napiforme TaxID=42672 RepID=A0A8H5I6V5_9HYPO|nr:DAL5-Allantoate ureidosuccinate permease [Fusarium napiforme]
MGILQDTNLSGNQYSWVSSFFYVGFLIASPLSSILLVKFPVAKVVVLTVLIWAGIQMVMAAGKSFASLAVLRILLGAFEAAIGPGFTIITSTWYKPSEHALRHGLWYGGASVFGSVIIKDFGYSVLQTQLLSMSVGAFLLFFVILTVGISMTLKNARCLSIAILNFISLAGVLMVKLLPESNKIARLAGIWLVCAQASAFLTTLSLVSSNITGHIKKATVNGMLFVGLCVGYIIGPLTFIAQEAPGYKTAFNIMVACYVLNIAIVASKRQIMVRWNKQRNQQHGAEAVSNGHILEHAGQADLDETDWEDQEIRYSL